MIYKTKNIVTIVFIILFNSFFSEVYSYALKTVQENDILKERINSQSSWQTTSVVIIILLIILLVIIYSRYQKKAKSYDFLNEVFHSVTHSFIIYDVYNESVELVNNAAEDNDSPYSKLLKNNNREIIPFTLDKIIETRNPHSVEFEEKINGQKKYFECFGFPILNDKGYVAKVIEYIVDVTDKQQAVNNIRTAFEKERELNELKSNFISSTSHEFRTPLATLFSSVELIQHYDRTKSTDKKNYHLDRIKDIVVYMTKMLDNILTINKSEADKIEFQPEIVNIKSFCSEILEDIIISAGDKHLIEQVFEGGQKLVFIDPNLVRHIITNLLSNAIKYSPEGGKIVFKTEILDSYVRITVRDEGIGIPKEDLKNLYKYFFRARNSKTISGTGLGLSIVKKAVEVHKGKINLSSTEGEGTTFIVTLPTDKNLVNVTNLKEQVEVN